MYHCVTRFLVFARSSFLNDLYENEDMSKERKKKLMLFTLLMSSFSCKSFKKDERAKTKNLVSDA